MSILARLHRGICKWKDLTESYKEIHSSSIEMISDLREGSLRYAESLRIKSGPYGRFRYKSGNGPGLLYASVFAALLFHLLGGLRGLNNDAIVSWAEYINSYQNEDGLYRDPLVENEIAEIEDWWGWRHLTLVTLMALHSLDAKPRFSLNYLERVSTPSKMRKWLGNLDWEEGVSFTSNAVQNYGSALQYARDYTGQAWLQEAIDELLGIISDRCNPVTGLWGSGHTSQRQSLSNGVQAGYHFWLLFWYEGIEIPYAQRVADSIIRLQGQLGGFPGAGMYSSACEDIDGLDPLVRISIRYPELKPVACKAVKRCLRWILTNFNVDGGASFRRDSDFFFGHRLMKANANESSIFSTWFRFLSLAIGIQLFENFQTRSQFNFLCCPGYQFSPFHTLIDSSPFQIN